MRKTFLAGVLAVAALSGCTTVYYGGVCRLDPRDMRVMMPPFKNETDDDHASAAMTELTATALLERGVPLVQTEPLLYRNKGTNAFAEEGLYSKTTLYAQATHLLLGTVHEYRYKTDLDGDPAVGLTVRLVDTKDGRTVWQGSSMMVDTCFASLTTASQRAVRDLVARIPLARYRPEKVARAAPIVLPALAERPPPPSAALTAAPRREETGQRCPICGRIH